MVSCVHFGTRAGRGLSSQARRYRVSECSSTCIKVRETKARERVAQCYFSASQHWRGTLVRVRMQLSLGPSRSEEEHLPRAVEVNGPRLARNSRYVKTPLSLIDVIVFPTMR